MKARSVFSAPDRLSRPDLAAAPLGTDEEAAGAPTAHKEIAQARSNASAPSQSNACTLYVAVMVLIGAAFVSVLFV